MKILALLFSNKPIAKLYRIGWDVLLINLACLLAYGLRYEIQSVDPANDVPYIVYAPFVILFTTLLILVYRHHGLYHIQRRLSWLEEFYELLNGTTTGTVITIVILFLQSPTFYSRVIFIYAGLFTIGLLGLSRLLQISILRWLRRHGVGTRRLLIVGAGEMARVVMRAVVAHPENGLHIVGFLNDDPKTPDLTIGRFRAFGHIDNLDTVLTTEQIDEVIITLPWKSYQEILSIMVHCENRGVRARIVPDLFQMTINRMRVVEIAGLPMISPSEIRISGLNQLVKRSFDILIASLLLILLSPILAVIALLIKLGSPGPIVFKQKRVGKNGQLFEMYKLRSMVKDAEAQKSALVALNEADGPLFKMRNDPRVTGIGKWLRRSSFDELPQLYNVIRGEMSLIGPRPPLPTEVAEYQEWHLRRLEVAPGITGLGQVSGRSELTFDEVALLDIYYIENWSLFLDTKILLQTIPRVILGSGAY